jgi:hypothetical protein
MVALGGPKTKLLTMLDEQAQVPLNHRRNQAGVVEQRCLFGRLRSLLLSSLCGDAINLDTSSGQDSGMQGNDKK